MTIGNEIFRFETKGFQKNLSYEAPEVDGEPPTGIRFAETNRLMKQQRKHMTI